MVITPADRTPLRDSLDDKEVSRESGYHKHDMEPDPTPVVTEAEQTALDRLVRKAVWQAREQVLKLKAEKRLISRHYDYPKLDQFESGQIKVNYGDGPINHGGAFKIGAHDRWFMSYDDVPALGELGQLAIDDANLRARLLAPGLEEMDEWRERWVRTGASRIPLEILDRLMNMKGDDFSEGDLCDAWAPRRNALLWDNLPVEIIVPIPLVRFDAPVPIELAPGMMLEPIPEGEQRARVPKQIWNGAANQCVVAAATHAVVIRGYELPGQGRMLLEYGRPSFYPLDKIELIFQALRIATSHPVGYAQTYMRPIDWAWHYTADLPPILQGSIARRYPAAFDDYGWLRPAEVVTRAEIDNAAIALIELQEGSRSLKLASRRFSGAALRADDDDVVLDLCIALEAALGDRQRTEMTYKLGMRTAAVVALARRDGAKSADVLRQVKRLYDWRSAVAHGSDQEKARQKFIEAAGSGNGIDAATSMLRLVLRQLVHTPELRKPETIDEKLVSTLAVPER
jgi:hypothetical protein